MEQQSGNDPQAPLKDDVYDIDIISAETNNAPQLTIELQSSKDNNAPTLNTESSYGEAENAFLSGPTFRHAPTLRDYLELPPRDKEPDDIDFDIAITYLRDALKIRPPQRRIRNLLQRRFKPLTAYRLMKSWIWARTIYILIWINMLLAVWEPPQQNIDNNIYWNASRVRSIIIYQLVFCCIYSFDIYLKFYSHDKREIGQWTYIILVCLFYEFIIAIITLLFHENKELELLYRASRVIRPCFLFYRSRDLKKLARSILRGIPSLFEVSALIILFLLLFSFAAYYIFHENPLLKYPNPNFKSFGESVYSLVVLQTTANFPDVMMPSYDESEWTALFFFMYNVLGIYFLMALVLAVIYNNYSDHILHDVERIKAVRERAMKEAFKVLTYHQNNKKANKLPKKYKKVVYFSTFSKIMKRMRSDLNSKFGTNTVNEQIKWIYLTMANVTLRNEEYFGDKKKREYDDGLNKTQFLQIASFIELEISKDIAKAKRISVLKKTKEFQTQRNLLDMEQEHRASFYIMKRIPIYWYRFRLKLIAFWQWKTKIVCCKKAKKEKMIRHAHKMSMTIDSMFHRSIVNVETATSPRGNDATKRHSTWSQDVIAGCSSFEISTEYFVNLLVMASTVFVILDIYHLSAKVEFFAVIIIYAFMFEVILKMIAFGIRGYLIDHFNKLDCVLSIVAFLFEIVLKNTIKVIIIFRIIRLLRLLRAFSRFRVILRTSKAVLSSFRSLFILEFCIAYVFAILGMELFSQKINKDIVKQLCIDSAELNDLAPFQTPFWCNMFDGYYYQNNFNSFSHALVIQMELIVVNNWHIITEMFVKRTSSYARIYFLSVYFTAVVVVMNVLTAFVLEAFISQYENNETEMQRENDDNKIEARDDIETRIHSVIRLFKPENEITIYHYTRKLSKALFYEQLYPQLFKQNGELNRNITQRSYINSMYSNYKSSNKDLLQKLTVIEDINTEHYNDNNDNEDEDQDDDNGDDIIDYIIDENLKSSSQQELITKKPQIHNTEIADKTKEEEEEEEDDDDDEPSIKQFHVVQDSNTFIIKRDSISLGSVLTPRLDNVNTDTVHQIDFSVDSITIESRKTRDIVPAHALQTPSISTSNVHANYFEVAPTASALIAANRNKFHFISMPSTLNKKTALKNSNKLVSSKLSKINSIQIQKSKKKNSITD